MIQQFFCISSNYHKGGDLITWGKQILHAHNWSLLLYFNTQILRHSLDFNALYMTQQYFCQFLKIS